VDAILGECGAVDQLIDEILGTKCNAEGGPPRDDGPNPLPTPTLPPLPTPSIPPLPTPSLPIPTGGPSLPPLPTPTITLPVGGGGDGDGSPLPLPTPSIGLPGAAGSTDRSDATASEASFGTSYEEFMQGFIDDGKARR
jgi:hypothetical protein